ncbi:hypothetical protein H4S07_004677 [Coemansia furcata]|uniref:Uncharacterized protein n=1 Tax=Coemansia furcata TaxID=417177 RepID=A0ACC1L7Q3_9FUNG|nr:hypothetical protein H4S07_004677 [Coemansia furcata]
MLVDYRKLDPAEHCFDRIISLEMVEHVGHEYLPVYFAQCHRLLHPQHGVMVLQASTMNEERYAEYTHSVDFINKHIFPGGHCPSVSALVAAATKGSRGMLMLESAANYPEHYARTLRVWRERFLSGYDKVLATSAPKNPQLILQERELASVSCPTPTLVSSPAPTLASELEYEPVAVEAAVAETTCAATDAPAVDFDSPTTAAYNDVFRRKWEYYFAYCEGAFATRTLGCSMLVFTRTYNEDLSNKSIL